MSRRYYIEHEATGEYFDDGIALIGPFRAREAIRHLQDKYGDWLHEWGDLRVIRLTGKKPKSIYVNPRWLWIKEEKRLS